MQEPVFLSDRVDYAFELGRAEAQKRFQEYFPETAFYDETSNIKFQISQSMKLRDFSWFALKVYSLSLQLGHHIPKSKM